MAERQAETKPRLLIVDDVETNRAILVPRFEHHGFEVHEADCGLTALDMIAAKPFDIVLLDVMMPEIDGIDVLKRIRQSFAPAELPVIMVTAKSQTEEMIAAFALQANDYITKPVNFPVALARVNVQLERKRASEALVSANALLEERVAQRTSALVEINRKLQGEVLRRENSEAETRYMAFHDPLTGLVNRLLFNEALETALAQPISPESGVAVMFIDLDGFKSVNDTLGHTVGDLLLKQIAGDFRDLLGDEDLIARLGGDEFAILISGCDPQLAPVVARARALIETAGRQRSVEGHAITVSASIGIVATFDAALDRVTLLKNADLAMYQAKSDGRGTYRIFNPDMNARAQARRLLEIDMRDALDRGEYRLVYQPLVSLNCRQVVGFEALLRWHHPQRGLIAPDLFVPVAEETGLIVELGDWVMQQACREAASWPERIRIAVNVSTVQFLRGDIVRSVTQALRASGLSPQRLEIEITESLLLEKTEQNIETLERLHALGVRIVMDDFGTGYSSLGHLRRFRLDKIKIDRSFIRDIADNSESRAIVHAIANLGTSFGISTTAEGVETPEQLAHLANEGCTEVQGWFFSEALPAEEVGRMLAAPMAEAIDLCRAGPDRIRT